MVILKPIATAQEISVFVREHAGTSYSVVIIDDSLNKSTTETVTGATSDGVLTIDVTYNFKEGQFYSVKIYRSSALIAFQKIYVTAQTDFDKYTVLDGYYTEPTKANTQYVQKPVL